MPAVYAPTGVAITGHSLMQLKQQERRQKGQDEGVAGAGSSEGTPRGHMWLSSVSWCPNVPILYGHQPWGVGPTLGPPVKQITSVKTLSLNKVTS